MEERKGCAKLGLSVHFFGDVEENSDAGEGEEEAGAAAGDEGQWNSFGRKQRQDDADVEEGLKQDRGRDSECCEASKWICRPEGGAKAAVSEDREEDEDGHGAEEAELFGDVGVDEIRRRFGEVEEFLHALHVAAAHEAAGADGDERLVDVESGALQVLVGVEEGEHARAAPRNPEEQRGQAGRGGGDGENEILPLHAGEDEQHGGDATDDQGGAEVGLLDDQQHEDQGHDRGFEQRVAPVAHLVEARGEEPGEEQNDDGLGDLRGLEGEERAESNPAMGIVRVAEEEDQQQQHGGDDQRRVDESGGVVAGVVHAREKDHEEDSAQRPSRLAADEGVWGVIALLRHDGGGGEDHDQADDDQQEGGAEDPLVDAYTLCQCLAASGAEAR